jgi:hypothetical protein
MEVAWRTFPSIDGGRTSAVSFRENGAAAGLAAAPITDAYPIPVSSTGTSKSVSFCLQEIADSSLVMEIWSFAWFPGPDIVSEPQQARWTVAAMKRTGMRYFLQ